MADSSDEKTDLTIIVPDDASQEGAEKTPSELESVDALGTDWAIFRNTRLLLVPRSLFWGLVGLLIFCVAIIASLTYTLQDQSQAERERVANSFIQATNLASQRATATTQTENRIATATSEQRVILAAKATSDWAKANSETTATAEWQTTGTAQAVATQIVIATQTVEQKQTATAQSVAVQSTQVAQTAQSVSTATAERQAVLAAQATAEWAKANTEATTTAERQATSTAQTVATQIVIATQLAERKQTATAQRVATQSVRATQTAQAITTATAEARILLTPEPEAKVNIFIIGCDTGIDFGQGEVTNAWVIIQNVGDADATNLELSLSADDEEEEHSDKKDTVAFLPPDNQITFKLTVDTALGSDSDVEVVVKGDDNIVQRDSASDCANLDENAKKLIELAGDLRQVIPIPNPLKFIPNPRK